MERKAEIMVHAPQSFCYAPAGEMMQMAQTLARTTKRIFDILKQRTEQPDEIIRAWLDGMDIYLTAEMAKAYGLIDEIFDLPPAKPAPVIPVSTASPARPALEPGRTPDEEMIFSILHGAVKDGKITVRSKKNFKRDFLSFVLHSTIEEKI